MPTNSTANANVTISYGGEGTTDDDGDSGWQVAVEQAMHSMQGFAKFDRGTITTTQDEYDLSASNLDGLGARDFTGLYGFIILRYISGSGSVAFGPGTTNGAAWFGNGTLGAASTQTKFHIQAMTTTALVTASLKTLDLTVTGTIKFSVTVFAGAST